MSEGPAAKYHFIFGLLGERFLEYERTSLTPLPCVCEFVYVWPISDNAFIAVQNCTVCSDHIAMV